MKTNMRRRKGAKVAGEPGPFCYVLVGPAREAAIAARDGGKGAHDDFLESMGLLHHGHEGELIFVGQSTAFVTSRRGAITREHLRPVTLEYLRTMRSIQDES
jgi:hypothetical protein